jgi:hypothetical protein
MYCIHCGAERPVGASSCPACGELTAQASDTTAFTPYFSVGSAKLVVMTAGTFGLYPIFWFNKNWNAEQENTNELFHPTIRALFSPIFFYSFASRTKDRADAAGIRASFSPVFLTVVFLVMVLSGRFPDPWWMIALFSSLPMLPVQNALQGVNAAHGIGVGREARFSVVNIIWLAFVAVLLLLALAGWMMGDPALEP